jgi:hypothetical protein
MIKALANEGNGLPGSVPNGETFGRGRGSVRIGLMSAAGLRQAQAAGDSRPNLLVKQQLI